MTRFKDFLVQPWIYVLFLVIGVSFKFYHIDYRYFWYDEIATVMQTSGLNEKGIDQLAPVNEIASLDYYKSFVHLNDLDQTLAQQLKGQLNTMNLNPLHYFLLAFWHRLAGDDSIALRGFSIFFFLLTLPFIFLLAKKLFNNHLSGWIAVSLFSISQYAQNYSHETRYITLTIFFIVTASYFLLEALDRKKFYWWLGYVVTGTLALYSSAILGLLLFSHFLFVIISRKEKFLPFFISICATFLLYLPWFLFIVSSLGNVEESLSWQKSNENLNFLILILLQLITIADAFIALEEPFVLFEKRLQIFTTVLYFLLAVFIVASIFYAARKMRKQSFYFLLFMFLFSFLFFLTSDLIRHANSSLFFRYHYIQIVAALFFMSFLLSRKINIKNIFYFSIYVVIALLGISSMQKLSQNNRWLLSKTVHNCRSVDYIDKSENCLIVSDFTRLSGQQSITAFLMEANAIESEKVDILRTTPGNPDIKEMINENRYSDIFVIYASEQLLKNLRAQYGDRLTQIEDPELYNPVYKINL